MGGWGGAGGWGENSVFYSSGSTSKSLSAPLRTAPVLIFYSSGSAAKPRLRPVADCHDLLFIWQFLWIFSNRANRIYSQPISSKISYRTILYLKIQKRHCCLKRTSKIFQEWMKNIEPHIGSYWCGLQARSIAVASEPLVAPTKASRDENAGCAQALVKRKSQND